MDSHCRREHPLLFQGVPQVGVRLGEVGFEPDGFLEGSHRFGQLPLQMQGDPKVVVPLIEGVFESDGFACRQHTASANFPCSA